MFVKRSLRDRLICFADFRRKSLLAVLFPATTTQLFSQSLVLTLFAAVLKFFPPLVTSAISGAANSSKSALKRFTAGTMYLHKN